VSTTADSQPAKLKPSYDPQQTWLPPRLQLLTSTKWCQKWRHTTGSQLEAMFVQEDQLANRQLQTLLLFWLDVRSLENIWHKSVVLTDLVKVLVQPLQFLGPLSETLLTWRQLILQFRSFSVKVRLHLRQRFHLHATLIITTTQVSK